MAKKQDLSLDPGFEEVSLDEGFKEIPLESSLPIPSAAPTPLNAPEQKSTLNALGDVGVGASQGLTLGFADELYGALAAAAKKTTGSEKDLPELYRQYQQLAQERYKEAKERSPYLTTGAEIIGGAILPGGAMIQGAKGLTTGAAIARGAGIGALAGGVAGLGASEKPLSKPKELAKDVAASAALGGILGGTTSAIGRGAKALKEAFSPEESRFTRQMLEALESGKKEERFFGRSAEQRMNKNTEKAVKEISDTLKKGREFGSKEYEKFLESFKSPIKPTIENVQDIADLETLLVNNRISFGKSKTDSLLESLERFRSGKALPREIKDLQKNIRELVGSRQDEVGQLFSRAEKSLSGELKKLPGYDEVNKLYRQSRELSEIPISKMPEDLSETFISKSTKPGEKIAAGAKKIVTKSQEEFLGGREQAQQLDRLLEKLKEIKETNPKMLEDMGIKDPQEFINKIQKASDLENIFQTIKGQNVFNQGTLGATTRQAIYGGANIAGLGLKTAKEIGEEIQKIPGSGVVKSVGKVTRNLFNLTDDQLKNVASTMQNTPGTKFLGTALQNALDNKSVAAKNAALFTISQNPEARSLVKHLVGE